MLEARCTWAQDVQDRAEGIVAEIGKQRSATANVQKGAEVALGNLQSHVRTLQQKYEDAAGWTENVIQEQVELHKAVNATNVHLRSIPVNIGFLRYLPQPAGGIDVDDGDQVTLAHCVDARVVRETKNTVMEIQKVLSSQLQSLDKSVQEVVSDTDALARSVERAGASSQQVLGVRLEQIEEINVLVNKIVSDAAHVAELISQGRAMGQVSRIAALQTRNYLPAMVEYFDELQQILLKSADQRSSMIEQSLASMQGIAATEASFAKVQSDVLQFDYPEGGTEAFETLSVFAQTPLAYGLLLVEAIRREEWTEKLRNEATVLVQDAATHREEEQKRRKKWFKSVSHLIPEVPASTPSTFDLNIQSSEDELPPASRTDVQTFLKALSSSPELSTVTSAISKAFAELDAASVAKQAANGKGFKSGSVHDISQSSFLRKESHDVAQLRELNGRLEEELRGQKSRVRKLEHLVFSQSQSSRSSSANYFQSSTTHRPESPAPSPDQISPMPSPKSTGMDLLARKASVNSRRASGNKSQDEKALARRIVTLEAELHDERQKALQHSNDASAQKEANFRIQSELDQARLTSKDLLANMDAQQREFADERRMLRDEVNDWKRKLDEVEDEFERMSGSREHEKLEAEGRYQALDRHTKSLEGLNHRHQEEQQEHRSVLMRIQNAMQVFNPDDNSSSSTQGFSEVLQKLNILSEQAAMHLKRMQESVEIAKVKNQDLQRTIDKQDAEKVTADRARETLEQRIKELGDQSQSQVVRNSSLQAELQDARSQLKSLREKFAEGETGSEALRQRLENQAAKAAKSAADLVEVKNEVERLKHELSVANSRQSERNQETSAVHGRLQSRSIKDLELSRRLAGNINELARLLEALGLCVLEREDGTMSIQRTSKLTSASQNLSDSTTMASSVSPLGQPVDLAIPATLLSWAEATTIEEEDARFSYFLSKIDSLDLASLGEAILKLRRDVEWTGKKWKAEARNYRDKLHAAQHDAANKIAFRSFKDGDLALFLPTRNQANRPWAAFNVGAPHYFLREQDSHKLQSREWLVARISNIQERVVDLSRSLGAAASAKSTNGDSRSLTDAASGSNISFDDDNPFELSDGLRWYLLDAAEEKPNALSSMTLRTVSTHGKSAATVASANVDAKGTSVKVKSKDGDVASKLGKSLESRRSSTTSRAGSIRATKDGSSDVSVKVDVPNAGAGLAKKSSLLTFNPSTAQTVQTHGSSSLGIEVPQGQRDGNGANATDEVRKDQLWGP